MSKKCSQCGVEVNIRPEDNDSYAAWTIRHKTVTGCKGGIED